MMRSISTHLLLATALFVFGIYYHDDGMLLLAGNYYRSKNNSVHQTQQNQTLTQSTATTNSSKYDQVDDDNDIDNHWKAIINAAEVANYTCTGAGPTSIQATLKEY